MTEAKQGHLYQHGGIRVLALESGNSVRVAPIEELWIGPGYTVKAEWLKPLPMVYFHGEVPR
jgi:hypothetical protein